jgi:hypothetical protein
MEQIEDVIRLSKSDIGCVRPSFARDHAPENDDMDFELRKAGFSRALRWGLWKINDASRSKKDRWLYNG